MINELKDIHKLPDGRRIRITVNINVGWTTCDIHSVWSSATHTCEKGKRTWRNLPSEEYQKLGIEAMEHETKLKLWKSLKPIEK